MTERTRCSCSLHHSFITSGVAAHPHAHLPSLSPNFHQPAVPLPFTLHTSLFSVYYFIFSSLRPLSLRAHPFFPEVIIYLSLIQEIGEPVAGDFDFITPHYVRITRPSAATVFPRERCGGRPERDAIFCTITVSSSRTAKGERGFHSLFLWPTCGRRCVGVIDRGARWRATCFASSHTGFDLAGPR